MIGPYVLQKYMSFNALVCFEYLAALSSNSRDLLATSKESVGGEEEELTINFATAIDDILNVLGDDFADIFQAFIGFVQTRLGFGINVQFAGLLNEGVCW